MYRPVSSARRLHVVFTHNHSFHTPLLLPSPPPSIRYQNFPNAFYSVMMWLLGDFDRDELRHPAALGFMMFSMFLTVLVMLNLVIAVRAIAHPRTPIHICVIHMRYTKTYYPVHSSHLLAANQTHSLARPSLLRQPLLLAIKGHGRHVRSYQRTSSGRSTHRAGGDLIRNGKRHAHLFPVVLDGLFACAVPSHVRVLHPQRPWIVPDVVHAAHASRRA